MADTPRPSRRTTSREQVSRIDRGYYLRMSPLRSWRAWLGVGGTVAAAGFCAWGALDAPLHHSPGAVAAAHARWERDCRACHVPFTPIKQGTWYSTDATRSAMDAKCEACHRGPAHHPLQAAVEVGSCASCHVDHRGRGADISRVVDRTCTDCHADISKHRLAGISGSNASTPSITRFDSDHHPEFAGLKADPGALKFSHGRHMMAGLVFGGPSKNGPMTYAMLPETERQRYLPPGAAGDELVQLSCTSCHEFSTPTVSEDGGHAGSLAAGSRPGAYALPVSFERHCVACHTLPFEAGGSGEQVPHGLDAEGMQRFILTTLLEHPAPKPNDTLLDLPQALPANPRPVPPPIENLRTKLREQVDVVRRFTRGMCGKCHDVVDAELPVATLLAEGGGHSIETWFRVPPVGIPKVWLPKARFNHGPHRGFDCRLCHQGAFPAEHTGLLKAETAAEGTSPLDHQQVMIAGRDSCVACHAPPGLDATGAMIGGARFDCVECHGYHGLGQHHGLSPSAAGVDVSALRDAMRLE